jgi:hypothetical protein
MTAAPRLATFTIVGPLHISASRVLGWGGFALFFSHPARIALTIAVFVMSGAALFSGGNLSPGEREDRTNRWVLVAFAAIGLLAAYVPAYTDRKEIWTFDGDTVRWLGVALFAAGGALRLWPVFVLGRRFSGLVVIQPGIRWSPLVSTKSSATRATWGCSSTRLGGLWSFVRASGCCSRRSLSLRSSRAYARKRRCYERSSAVNTMRTAPARRGWFPGSIDARRHRIRIGSQLAYRARPWRVRSVACSV